MARLWTLDDIPWDEFDPTKVDPEIIKIVKAAAMVESNAADYAAYLCNVFADDPEFQEVARAWADEEVQHGLALGRWASLVDGEFDYDERFQRFRDGYKIPIESDASVRGSRTGELIARCMVEVGTSSYYTAIGESTEEPVLKEICRRIATDEWRHYGLFYRHMKRYLELERLSRLRRLKIALSRIAESEDDELAYAFFAANDEDGDYDRETCTKAYFRRAAPLYRPRHIERALSMVLKAVGFRPNGLLNRGLTGIVTRLLELRIRRMSAA